MDRNTELERRIQETAQAYYTDGSLQVHHE